MAAADARDDTAYLQDHGSGREQRHPQWRARWAESDPELDYVLDIYTAFMECSAVFREMDPAIARGEICIGASELEAIEVIEFCLKQDVALADSFRLP